MCHSLKKHRLSSKKFFLVYPKVSMRNGNLITLSCFDIKTSLCPLFENRQVEAFVIYEQSADAYYQYDYFSVFILLKMTKNIVNPRILDIKGVRGCYSTVKTLVFDKCNVSHVHYLECLDDIQKEANNKLLSLTSNDNHDVSHENDFNYEFNLKDKLIRNLIVAI